MPFIPPARTTPSALVSAAALALVAGLATAQSDPSLFGTVYNVGTVPAGSMFDVPGAVATLSVGGGTGALSPANLTGRILQSNNQLNLFSGGEIRGVADPFGSGFQTGPTTPQGVSNGFNIEVNIFGGTVGGGFTAVGNSIVNVFGGTLTSGLLLPGAQMMMSGGQVDLIRIFGGEDSFFNIVPSTMTISGGSADVTDIELGTLNVTGGSVSVSFFSTFLGATVNQSGGEVTYNSALNFSARANLSGGVFSQIMVAPNDDNSGFFGGFVTFRGNDFIFEGEFDTFPISGSFGDFDLSFAQGFVHGVLADGSVFILSTDVSDRFGFRTAEFIRVPVPAADLTPMTLSSGIARKGLRPGQTLTLTGDGALGNFFAAVDATLNIEGGSSGSGLEVLRSVVNISGGTIGDRFIAHAGSTVNLFGTSLLIGGSEPAGLTPGEPFTIASRGGTIISGTLADGTPFDFRLSSAVISNAGDFFSQDATVTFTLVQDLATPPCNPADLSDTPTGSGAFGQLDGNDIGAFIAAFLGRDAIADLSDTPPGSGAFGQFDGNDIGAFVTAFLAGCP